MNTKKKTNIEFVFDSKLIHGDKYDYSLVNYINNKCKVKIICKEHGVFEQRPNDHLKGCGCSVCSNNKKLNNNYFINKAKIIHGDRYDYSLVQYKNIDRKVIIICKEHGIFNQSPYNHLNGANCPKCSHNILKTTIHFITDAKKIHGNIYDYSLIEYKNAHTKVKIICEKHGIFEQKPYSHLQNIGCPRCNSSKGEIEIIKRLENLKINFETQKKFNDCKYKQNLSFDFYLPEYNICIEYDGEQHYKSVEHWGGDTSFNIRLKRDQIKNDYCLNNNIILYRINHKQNIEDELNIIFDKIKKDNQ